MSKSMIDTIRKFVEETGKEDLPNHVLICIETDEEGIPVGTAINVKGRPFETLGMIELALHKLEQSREEVIEKFESVERESKNRLSDIPEEAQQKLRDLEKRARQAAQEGDLSALFALKAEAEEYMQTLKEKMQGENNDDDDDSDSSNFNLSDFKNL